MEAVLFVGIPGSGKSTFYRECFFDTHLRINLDMLRTRRRERVLLQACLAAGIPFVVDNTNPTREERARYVAPARAAGFRAVAYFFEPDVAAALARNRARKRQVPVVGVRATLRRLEPPTPDEGFDAVYRVRLTPDGRFLVFGEGAGD